ncbi:uncharacterized protein LOC116253314 isoform X2 [Nymphaea colorata]|uniref:uncharacterized protein LOC116253314 isoform X2 n=1 Tax=Nymphaea colorata TaxID=210225 RepID=UPI00214E9791|nr:uncharacterized protein LOC116253314 isoform X2 [Nymphaea colorata]
MRIRNSRNPIDVVATIHGVPSLSVNAPLSDGSPAERPRPQPPAAPELGPCVVNKSPWDVTALVLAFFHADGLLRHCQQVCPSHHDNKDGDCHQASTQAASALEEKHGHFRSDLSRCVSSIKPCGNDWRRGKGKQEGKRSKPLCLKTEGSATDPATIPRSLQNSRRRAAKKGADDGSPATLGRGSAEGVKSRTCKREDGKGWRCGNEAKAGSTLCEHHLSQVRSYCKRPSNDSSKRRSPSMPEGGEGRRKRPTAQSSWATTSVGNDCYYYYYTGFGPAWRETKRKRVSAIAEDDGTDDDGGGGGTGADTAAAAAGGGNRVNGEGGEDGGKGKIKGRKRVKCRSLKSLL